MKLKTKEFARKCCYFLEECKLFCKIPPLFEVIESVRLPDSSFGKRTSFLEIDSEIHLCRSVDFISIHQVTCDFWRQRYRHYLVFFDSLNERQRHHWLRLLIDSGFDDCELDKLYYSLLKSN